MSRIAEFDPANAGGRMTLIAYGARIPRVEEVWSVMRWEE